jgi:hypothetical protein
VPFQAFNPAVDSFRGDNVARVGRSDSPYARPLGGPICDDFTSQHRYTPVVSFFADPHAHHPRAPANPRLLKALSSAHNTTDLTLKNGLYEALLNSTLVIPVASEVSGTGAGRGRQQFLLVEDDHGPTVPVFSDLQAMQRWQPGATQFVSVPMTQLLRESFPPAVSGIWLNLADRTARFVSRAELSHITGGLIQPSYAQQVEVELAPLHEDFEVKMIEPMPVELVQKLSATLRREADVASGYLFQVNTGVKGERVAVGIRLTRLLEPAQIEQLLKRIKKSLTGPSVYRGTIDVIVLDYAKHKKVGAAMPALFER